MLFDLKTGRRRRVVQIVFGFLAFIFFISFVGFGIGSDVSGGIFDAIGLGGGGSTSSTSSQYEQQIEDAEARVAEDPKDEKALSEVAYFRYLSGVQQLDLDESTGVATLSEEARSEWGLALESWEELLALEPKKLDPQAAGVIVCAYVPVLPQCRVQATEDAVDFAGAIKTQELIAEEDPSSQNLTGLAYFLLADGRIDEGRKVADEAIAKASGSEREAISKQFDKLIKQATEIQKAEKKAQQTGAGGAASGEGQLQNPFGGLGTDTGVAAP
jgi:tetratricopeptide (TPR) repeat protein